MRVKRFTGNNVAETMGKIKQELGPEAIILQTRQYREGGFLGLFAKPKVEITAAIDYQRSDPRSIQRPLPERKETVEFPKQVEVQKQLLNMQATLEKMSQRLEKINSGEIPVLPALHKWAKALEKAGVNDRLAKHLLTQVEQSAGNQNLNDDVFIRLCLEEVVRQHCANIGAIQLGLNRPTIVALIGPTGVGKTTTIGKLAAGFGVVDNRKVALVTIDTFRVAAVDQLRTFGQIIGAPVEVAMTPAELGGALSRHNDKDLIFIDTAGRSPQHQLHMHELKAFIEVASPNYTMLVLSATSQFKVQQRVIKEFKPLATHLILTKLDETTQGGPVLNLLEFSPLPVAYLTNGQNVPNDIEAATADGLARYIFGEVQIDGGPGNLAAGNGFPL